MTALETAQLNLDLFQLWLVNDKPEINLGINVDRLESEIDDVYMLNPQADPDNPDDFMKPSPGPEQTLRTDESNPPSVVKGRLYLASIAVRAVEPGYDLFSLMQGGERELEAPSPEAIGRAALVGLIERPDFTVTRLINGPSHRTQRLCDYPALRYYPGYNVNLFLLSEGGRIQVVCGPNHSVQRYDLTYSPAVGEMAVQERQGNDGHGTDYEEGEEDEGPGPGGDREPRRPIQPESGAAAEVEEPATEEEPLILRGKAA